MFVIFIGAFWPIFINTLNGVHTIEARLIGVVVTAIMLAFDKAEKYLLRWRG
jgi:ABC-type nitrate/sulfonate/bicarbonate transport system permease component